MQGRGFLLSLSLFLMVTMEFFAIYARRLRTKTQSYDNVHMCYSCKYNIRYGIELGNRNCAESFDPMEVEQILCERGSFCGKIYHEWTPGSEEYLVRRACIHSCENITHPQGYIRCCVGDLCNNS